MVSACGNILETTLLHCRLIGIIYDGIITERENKYTCSWGLGKTHAKTSAVDVATNVQNSQLLYFDTHSGVAVCGSVATRP